MTLKRLLTATVLAVLLAGAAFQPVTAASSGVSFDSTNIAVDVQKSGNAVFSVTYKASLDSDSEKQTFKQFSKDVSQNTSTYLESFREKLQPTVNSAENSTDRNMSMKDLYVKSGINGDTGYVTYSFTWTNFADASGDTVKVGDALNGMVLTDSMSLTVTWPSSWSVKSASDSAATVKDSKAVWKGQQELSGTLVTLETGDSAESAPTESGSDSESGVSAPGFTVTAAVVVLSLSAFYLRRRR